MKAKTGDREIPLTPEEYSELERALQWPEDLDRWDRIARPTKLSEVAFCATDRKDDR